METLMDRPCATRVVNGANTIALPNVMLRAGVTYYVTVAFRTRGDGDSTPSKCSSVGFIAHWDDWAQARSYIHGSARAYEERGQFVKWTYTFTVPKDVQPQGTALYFIINNGWANGYDNQTIDLYYAEYRDSSGEIHAQLGGGNSMLNVMQGGAPRQPKVFSTTKYTTPSLCCRKGGATWYVPLVRAGGTVSIGGVTYRYDPSKYPRLAVRYGGSNLYAVNASTELYKQDLAKPMMTIYARTRRVFVSGYRNSYAEYYGQIGYMNNVRSDAGYKTGRCELYGPNGTLLDIVDIPSGDNGVTYRSYALYRTERRSSDSSYDKKAYQFRGRLIGWYGNNGSTGQYLSSGYIQFYATCPVFSGYGSNDSENSSQWQTGSMATVTKSRDA